MLLILSVCSPEAQRFLNTPFMVLKQYQYLICSGKLKLTGVLRFSIISIVEMAKIWVYIITVEEKYLIHSFIHSDKV